MDSYKAGNIIKEPDQTEVEFGSLFLFWTTHFGALGSEHSWCGARH